MRIKFIVDKKELEGEVINYDGLVATVKLNELQTIPVQKKHLPKNIVIQLERRKF